VNNENEAVNSSKESVSSEKVKLEDMEEYTWISEYSDESKNKHDH
jgi:hypothetical protein